MTSELYRRNEARRHRLGFLPFRHSWAVAWANVGRNHPDYGMTQNEHMAAKAKRAKGK